MQAFVNVNAQLVCDAVSDIQPIKTIVSGHLTMVKLHCVADDSCVYVHDTEACLMSSLVHWPACSCSSQHLPMTVKKCLSSNRSDVASTSRTRTVGDGEVITS